MSPLTSLWHLQVLQALRALNPLGPLAVPVAAPLCLGPEKRQDFKMWRCMEHGGRMEHGILAFWVRILIALQIFSRSPMLHRRLLLGDRLEERLLNREASFYPLNAPTPTQQSRWAVRVMWIRISRLSWSSARSCKLSRQEKCLARKWNREIIETQSTSSKFEKSHATSLQPFWSVLSASHHLLGLSPTFTSNTSIFKQVSLWHGLVTMRSPLTLQAAQSEQPEPTTNSLQVQWSNW